uniref:Uncharacterized protein n=1 Tax=Anguilla anguilla TaxID=7936 RepID=A0A0E9RXT9_ANGAN
MWATTLKPASLARWKDSHTALTVWPLHKQKIHRRGFKECPPDRPLTH